MKVASEDNRELILLTKKSSSNKIFGKNLSQESVEAELFDSNSNENKNENLKKSPNYIIEFDSLNKLEVVPKQNAFYKNENEFDSFVKKRKNPKLFKF